jgi:hypothetical protein
MAFRCTFANLVVGDGTALKLENAQNARKKLRNVVCRCFTDCARVRLDSSIRDGTWSS